MRAWIVIAGLVVAFGCSKKDSSPRGLCERGCTKILGCVPGGATQEDSCVASCTATGQPPDPAQIDKLEAMSCEEIAQGGGAMAGGAPPGGAAPAAPAPAAGNGCTADCTGCVG